MGPVRSERAGRPTESLYDTAGWRVRRLGAGRPLSRPTSSTGSLFRFGGKTTPSRRQWCAPMVVQALLVAISVAAAPALEFGSTSAANDPAARLGASVSAGGGRVNSRLAGFSGGSWAAADRQHARCAISECLLHDIELWRGRLAIGGRRGWRTFFWRARAEPRRPRQLARRCGDLQRWRRWAQEKLLQPSSVVLYLQF
ncbi:uncharacterized protein LOC119368575 isoform X2 [Triticum dicoccoides]|uniref:uncharacterized protein LOC119368575 isoform X2 n=1 Tax=Triticum dicoccoides TaxID=85692 RepID=UPI00188F1754|nr:uncharacterized protein LOC119368575 isoform X2 [Triticum dicoccoides]